MQYNNFFIVPLIGSFVIFLAGCSNPDSKYTKVEGTITHKGQPVEGASVTFVALDTAGESASGITNASGQYTLTSTQSVAGGGGVLPGDYQVIVSKRQFGPPDPDEVAYNEGRLDYDEYQKRLSAKDPSRAAARPKELFEKYAQQRTTDLQVTVTKGKTNTHNFDVTD
jgi:hypothetical protein